MQWIALSTVQTTTGAMAQVHLKEMRLFEECDHVHVVDHKEFLLL